VKFLAWAAMGSSFYVATLIGGCSRAPDQLREMHQSLQSALATVQTAMPLWDKGDLPRIYVRQTITAAEETVEQQEKQIAKIALSQNDKQQLEQQLAALRQKLSNAMQATNRADISAARQIAASLETPSFMTKDGQ
jgi:hypothetical protein